MADRCKYAFYPDSGSLLENEGSGGSFTSGSGKSTTPSGARFRNSAPDLPVHSELQVARHFSRIALKNFSVDMGLYPLGSCTMKYNPRINEWAASLPGFSGLHPYMPEEMLQGALELVYKLERSLSEISGMAEVSLQPAAGAQGEFTGIRMIRDYFEKRGEQRPVMLIPDSAHGTNPASSALCGFEIKNINSSEDGYLLCEEIKNNLDSSVAGIMITNPNTLGIFEKQIAEIADLLHANGSFLYCDGANLNAIMGKSRPGDMGVDVIQFNLHKTFSTPHGGGGPGSGPVGVCEKLRSFMPRPVVVHENGRYSLSVPKDSIGKVKAFYGHFGVMVRAYAYIIGLGAKGLREASEVAVLNAAYLRKKLQPYFDLPYSTETLHEFVFSDARFAEKGVKTLDIAKRLLDSGFHPPTVYFPLIVSGAMMIEPTETEPIEELDRFIEVMIGITEEISVDPDRVKAAPEKTPVGRLDEVLAARKPVLKR